MDPDAKPSERFVRSGTASGVGLVRCTIVGLFAWSCGCDGAPSFHGEDVAAPEVADSAESPDGIDGCGDDCGAWPPDAFSEGGPSRFCGNGILDEGEECDDGNRMNGDDCDWLCRVGPGSEPDGGPDPDARDAGSLALARPAGEIEGVPWLGVPTSPKSDYLPLVWDGSAYATVVVDARTLPDSGEVVTEDALFFRFGTDGMVVGPGWRHHQPERQFGALDLAFDGTGFGLVWCGSHGALTFVPLDRDGKPYADPIDLVDGVGYCHPAIAWDGRGYVVVWTVSAEHRGVDRAGPALRRIRVSSRGVPFADPTTLYENPAEGVDWPSLAAAGERAFVAFVDGGTECGAPAGHGCLRYVVAGPSGELLFESFVVSPMAAGHPDAIAASDRFGVLWNAYFPTEEPTLDAAQMQLASVAFGGDLLAPPHRLTPCEWCSLGDSYAGAWGRSGYGLGIVHPADFIDFLRCDRSGDLVSSTRWEDTIRAYGGLNVAFDGDGFGVITGGGLSTIYFWRFAFREVTP